MDLKTLRETDENVVILPGAKVAGNVTFGPDCSVWYNAVIRGDEAPITIGAGTNIQDNAVLHSSLHNTTVGKRVTIGHGAIVHGCTVGDGCLIGMGAIVLDGAVLGKGCFVGAGALVTGGTNAPDGSLILGNPATVRGPITESQRETIRFSVDHYIKLKEHYR